jgi:hypothetical protein
MAGVARVAGDGIDERDRALGAVVVGDGERDASALGARHRDDGLSGLRRARHHRVPRFKEVRDVGEVLPRHDFERRLNAGLCAIDYGRAAPPRD